MALLGLSATGSGQIAPQPAAREVTVTILHTNDIHGRLTPFVVDTGDATAQTGDRGRPYQEYHRAGVVGGFARLAGAVESIRRTQGAEKVLLVDAGDAFGDGLLANLTRGAATLHLMNTLQYDFMALGNHDFEYTTARTIALQNRIRFPMRAANAIVRATGEPFLGDPIVVRTVAGVRIGLLALTYHNTDQTGNKENTRALRFESGIDAARRLMPVLRNRADVIVVVSHQGTVVDSMLAARVPGISVIVGGHSHDRIAPPRRVSGTSTWIVQALSDASALGELTLTVRNGRLVHVRGVIHELYADRYGEDTAFVGLLDSLRAPFRDTLDAVVATAAERIGRQYKSESPVDRLAAELLRRHANADVAILPGLGFGATWQPGPVTREMLVATFPHPTPVVREVMTGAQIVAVLEQSATNLRPANEMDRVGGLVQTAGVRWTVDFAQPVGSRVRDAAIGGMPVVMAHRYRVVTTGGMLQGTHRYTAFADGAEIEREPAALVEVLEKLMREISTIRAPAVGDVSIRR